MANGGTPSLLLALKWEVPKPKTFGGSRDAREIDIFLWGLEQYFDAMGILNDAIKV